MRRREFVVGALGAGLAASSMPSGALDGVVGAGGTASASQLGTAIPFGAAVRVDYLADQFDYKTAILEHCQIVVGEGGLKWIDLRPTRDDFVFDQPDRLIAFAEANGMKMRGHTLAWYGAMPDWTQQIASEAEAEGELVRHIETVVGRYKGRIPSWDVINEAIADHPTADTPYRDSIWQQRLGKRFIELSLRTAAAVDPDVQLVINDYAIENPTDQCRAKREALLNLLRDLKDRDVPLHAVGIQGHLLGDQEIDKDGLSRFVEAVAAIVLAGEFSDDLLDRPARRELDDGKGQQHDAEQRRDDQQQAPDNIGSQFRSPLGSNNALAPIDHSFLAALGLIRFSTNNDIGVQSASLLPNARPAGYLAHQIVGNPTE